jgi:quercetin dioxygenase-like cupin family protein
MEGGGMGIMSKSWYVGGVTALMFLGFTATPWRSASALQDRPQTAQRRHLFVKRTSAELHRLPTMDSRVMLTADQTDGRYSIVDEEFKPGMQSYPGHMHAFHSETFLILRGRMEWNVGGDTEVVGPGDLVYIPPDTPHATKVLGDETVHAIMIYEPGGYELGLRRRAGATPGQRQVLMELGDVVPVAKTNQ